MSSKVSSKSAAADDDEEAASSIVHEFAQFGASSSFSEDMEDWMNDNCECFEDADVDGEQDFRWSKLHAKFVDWLESFVEKFCKERNISSKKFYSAMEDAMEREEESALFPVFLLNTDYKNFIVEMRSRANKNRTDKLAQRVLADSSGDDDENYSGIWEPIEEKTSDDEIDEFMSILKIPWYVRGPWKRSMKSAMKYTIVHKRGCYIELTRQARFFGVRTTRYPFDEIVKGKDVEADASYTFERKDGCIQTDVARGKCTEGKVKKRFGPPGSSWEKIWKFGSDRNELVRVRTIILEDGTRASFHTYYERSRSFGDKRRAAK